MEAAYSPTQEKPSLKIAREDARIKQWLDNLGYQQRDIALVAEDMDTLPVGAIWCRIFQADQIVGEVGYVSNAIPAIAIGVEPDKRDQGVGSLLLNKLTSIAYDYGYEGLSLCVGETNPALRLYLRNGFEITRQEGSTLIMVKNLLNPGC